MRDFRQKETKKLPQNKPSRDEPYACPGVIPRPWSDQPIQETWRRYGYVVRVFLLLFFLLIP